MEVVFSERGKKLLKYNNFTFKFDRMLRRNEVERWRCAKSNCKAHLKVIDDSILEENAEHNHDAADIAVQKRKDISNSLKRKASEILHDRPKKIVRREIKDHTDLLSSYDVTRIKANLYREKRKHLPRLPRNLEELHDALNNYDVTTCRGENMLFKNDRVNNIVVFTCQSNINFLRQCKKVYVDGTFKSAANLFYQLFSVHAMINNHYAPLIYFLLPDKTIESYTAAFKILKDELNVNPDEICADFESGIHTGIRNTWPNIKVSGCRYHLGKSFFRKVQELGLKTNYENKDDVVGKFLRLFYGMSMLSPGELEDFFVEDIMNELPRNHVGASQFCDYILKTYLLQKSLFPPEVWAKKSSSTDRTTNCCESFHKHFNDEFYSKHPNIFNFVDVIVSLQIDTYTKMNAVNRRRNRQKDEKERILQYYIDKYDRGAISRLDYVKKVSLKFLPEPLKTV